MALYEAVQVPEDGWVVMDNHPGLLVAQVLVVFGDDREGAEREATALMREQFPPEWLEADYEAPDSAPNVGWPLLRVDLHELEQRQAVNEAADQNARAQLDMEERARRARLQKAAREAELRGAVMWGATCWDEVWGEHWRHIYAKTADGARRKFESFGWEVRSEVVRVGGTNPPPHPTGSAS